jgi:hypothetical protein
VTSFASTFTALGATETEISAGAFAWTVTDHRMKVMAATIFFTGIAFIACLSVQFESPDSNTTDVDQHVD